MKIIISESSGHKIENTIIGAINQSQDLGALVDTLLLDEFKYKDLYVAYEDVCGKKKLFSIYELGYFNDLEYCWFTNHEVLYNDVDLLSDCYDITILVDKHESECFIKVVNKKKKTDEMIHNFLSEFYNIEGEDK